MVLMTRRALLAGLIIVPISPRKKRGSRMGMQPDQQGVFFQVIVVGGGSQGVFLYDASGHLVDSMAVAANVDPQTNSNKQGTASYNPGLNYLQLFNGSLFMGSLNGSSTVNPSFPGAVAFGDSVIASASPHIAIQAPLTTATGQGASLFVNGESADASKPPQVVVSSGLEGVTKSLFEVQTGDIAVATAGNGYRTKEGSNAKQGKATLVGGTVVVANTSVTANSVIVPGYNTPSANAGAVFVSAVTAGTGFTLKSTNAADTSVVGYEIFEPA